VKPVVVAGVVVVEPNVIVVDAVVSIK